MSNLASTVAKNIVRSTASSGVSGAGVYETSRAVDEYLLFHYGKPSLLMPYSFGPHNALSFPVRTVQVGAPFYPTQEPGHIRRALDVGCAVGGSSFQLTKHCDQVVGLDFSNAFVDAAKEIQVAGKKKFTFLKQGQIFLEDEATVDPDINRSKVLFEQGDACNISPDLGTFDIIHASNLLCRLPSPRKFLSSLYSLLRPHGILVLVSPYSWLEEYTPSHEWIGGAAEGQDSIAALHTFINDANQTTTSGGAMQLLHEENMPFLIREHERKFQFGVSHCTIWKFAPKI